MLLLQQTARILKDTAGHEASIQAAELKMQLEQLHQDMASNLLSQQSLLDQELTALNDHCSTCKVSNSAADLALHAFRTV